MSTKGILLAMLVATVDLTFIEPVVFVGPLAVGGGPGPFAGGPLPPFREIVLPGGEAPRRIGTPPVLGPPGGGSASPTEEQPSPGSRPIQHPPVWIGQDRIVETVRPQTVGGGSAPSSGRLFPSSGGLETPPGGEAPRRIDTPPPVGRPGDGPAPPTEGRPSPGPRPIEDPPVRTRPPRIPPTQEQDRLVETVRPQTVGGGSAPSAGRLFPPAGGLAPPSGEPPRRIDTPPPLGRPGDGPAPPTEGRPSPGPRRIEDPPVRTRPPQTPPTQGQDRSVETVRPQTVGGGSAPSSGRLFPPAGGLAPPSGETPRRIVTPPPLGRPGDGPAPPTEGRPSPGPRPIEDPPVRTRPPQTPPTQEQDRSVESVRPQTVGVGSAPSAGRLFPPAGGLAPSGGEASRRIDTPPPAPPTEGRPSPGPRPIEDPPVRTRPPKIPQTQEQDRSVETVRPHAVGGGPAPSSGRLFPSAGGLAPPIGETTRRIDTPPPLGRAEGGPAPPTEGRSSPGPRPIEDPPVRTRPTKTPPTQEQNRSVETVRPQAVGGGPEPSAGGLFPPAGGLAPSGGEAPRRIDKPPPLGRPGDGPAPPTEGRPSPGLRPIEDPPVRNRPTKTPPTQEQDRSVETVRPQAVGGGSTPSAGGLFPPAGGLAPPSGETPRRIGTPPPLIRPGDGPVPPTEGKPSPGPRPPKTPPTQEQDRSVETVRPQVVAGSPAPSAGGALPPAGGIAPPSGQTPRRTSTLTASGRPGDRQVLPTEERPSLGPRPIQHPPVWTGPSKSPSKQQEHDRPIQHPPVWTGPPKTPPTRQQKSEGGPRAEGTAPPGEGQPTPSPRPIQHPPIWTGPRKTPPKQPQSQKEPAREQEVEEHRRGRPNPVTTPPSTVSTDPHRIPFSTSEFAVTAPPTTVSPNPPRSQPCPIAAVCGSDGYTYFSECFVPAGVWKECAGSCPCPVQYAQPSDHPVSACTCPNLYNPVCGVDGNTYDNDCWRRCNYVAKDCEGRCPCDRLSPIIEPVSCSCKNKEYSPVCSVSGNTYDNECELRCSGESKQCDSECPCTQERSITHKECVCNPYETDPVCTTDGETIWNGCEAMCAGKEIACTSTCPC